MRVDTVKSGGENGASASSSATGRLHTYNSCFWRGVSTMIIFRWCSSPVMEKGKQSGTTGDVHWLVRWRPEEERETEKRERELERERDGPLRRQSMARSVAKSARQRQNKTAMRAHSNGAGKVKSSNDDGATGRVGEKKAGVCGTLLHSYPSYIKITYRRYQSLFAGMRMLVINEMADTQDVGASYQL